VLYDATEEFPVGGAKLLRVSDTDDVTLIGAGVTVHECLSAADQLAGEGRPPSPQLSAPPVILVVVEDHHPEGGLGSAVLDGLVAHDAADIRLAHLAVRGMPGSGTSRELLAWAGIDADHIREAATMLIAKSVVGSR
jgi:transketolase